MGFNLRSASPRGSAIDLWIARVLGSRVFSAASSFESLEQESLEQGSVIDASVARRYARALLSLAEEDGQSEAIGRALEMVLQVLAQSPEAGHILRDPGHPAQERHATLDAIASAVQLSPLLVNFLRLLLDRKRIADLPQIARAYGALLDEKAGRVRATVTSAAPLSQAELGRISAALAALTGRSIVLHAQTDVGLIGGVVTQVGKTRYDGSLRTQLERLREELKRAPLQ